MGVFSSIQLARAQVATLPCTLFFTAHDQHIQKHPFTWRDICNTIGIGCSCKKGCATRGWSCLKAEQKCGPGCSCCNCENTFNALIHVALEVEIETAVKPLNKGLPKRGQTLYSSQEAWNDSHRNKY